MTKNIKKIVFFIGMGPILLGIIPYLAIHIQVIGEEHIKLPYQGVYQEDGASATFFSHPIAVETKGSINTSQLGAQQITYRIKNKLGPIHQKKRLVEVIDEEPPVITLINNTYLILSVGEVFQEPGYMMVDNYDGNITKKVEIDNHLDTSKPGRYTILYSGKDSSGNSTFTERIVEVIDGLSYQPSYDDIDNTPQVWWSGNKKNNQRPEIGAAATSEQLRSYNAYYMGADEKIIYLTFDEGSNDTYVKEIVDVLNQNEVKATFFFCNHFVVSNPDLMKFMIESGHSIGNHTTNHPRMSKYATSQNFSSYIQEIKKVEDNFYKITGQKMDKVYREPKGEWSYRSLQIMKNMGYKSFFWSADYLDWDGEVTKEYALKSYMDRYHNGAIYLIHPKNKGNLLALSDFIHNMKDLGYQFGLVKDIQ